MKSGVYYLYEYKNDQKSRNVGFLKFSQNSDSYFLQICTRGIPVFHDDLVSLAILYSSKDSILVIPCQTIKCENHAISCKLTLAFSENPFCGLLIELPDKTLLVAIEEGISFSTKKCRTFSKEIDNNTDSHYDETAKPEAEVSTDCELSAKSEADASIDCKLTTKPEADIAYNCWLTATTPQQTIRKIQRKNLSILPRRYWNLSNNRFLLHGYYNYNHLLLVEENGYFLLGVPGIYDKREARAADLFGFPTFSESYTNSLDLSSEETATQGRFGYWCKKIPAKTE